MLVLFLSRSPINPNCHISQAVALASKKKTAIAEPAPQGAGLKMAAHPLLLDTSVPAPQSKKDKYKPMQPKFASIRANIRNTPISTPPPSVPSPIPAAEVKSNPYAAKDAASGSFEGAAPKERTSRGFRFIQKGKYKQIADQVRQEAKLEELKQRIAESARKAGLDSELVEKNIRVRSFIFCHFVTLVLMLIIFSAKLLRKQNGGMSLFFLQKHMRI